MATLGERLRAARERAGLSQQQLAEKAGLTLSVLTRIEQHVTPDPRFYTVAALARALGLRLEELVGDEPGGPRPADGAATAGQGGPAETPQDAPP